MNTVVLNGSPKGELGVTLQYVRFAAKKFPLTADRIGRKACLAGCGWFQASHDFSGYRRPEDIPG